MTPSLLINASNLHAGGGVQVAVSILSELSKMNDVGLLLIVAASEEVDENLRKLGVDTSKFHSYNVVNISGFAVFAPQLEKLIRQAQITFTVFGPLYLMTKPSLSVVGFAQPWIIYPDNEVYRKQSLVQKLKTRIKYRLQKFFFLRNSNLIFVEAGHVKERLEQVTHLNRDQISIVANCTHEIFRKSAPDSYLPLKTNTRSIKIGFVGRDYPHKNLQVLPEVKKILQDEYQTDVDFHLTLNETEWSARSDDFRSHIKSVGTLTLDQCLNFYEEMDAIIFPSLLECFSATPIETMIMRKPLLASDRGFVRDFCDDFPYYFDPTSPQDIAAAIMKFKNSSPADISTRVSNAQSHALALSSPKERVEAYIRQTHDLLGDQVKKRPE